MTQSEPRARVEIDGQIFDSFLHPSLFSSVHVELTTNQASQVELTVIDENYKFLDSYSRADGIPLAEAFVWLGFGEDLGNSIFEGLLAGVGHGNNTSTLRFYDRSFLMRLEQKTEYHRGLDIDVINKLATRNGLNFEGPGSFVKGLLLNSKKQEAMTDWDFAMQLAEDAGLVLYVRDKTLFAKPPARTGEPVLTLGFRDAIVLRSPDFQYRVPENKEGRPGRVEVRGRGRGGHLLTGVSDESKRGRKHVVINRSIKGSKSEATRRAQAKKELEREPAFTGRIRSLLQTNVRADVRETVEMIDHGLLFSGKYLVDSAEHDFAPGKLATDYDLVRDIGDVGRF
jgi:hypothetical protein